MTVNRVNNHSRAYIGWDIGGAHLKVAHLLPGDRVIEVQHIVCSLWRGIAELERAYRTAAAALAATKGTHIITMSGELADSFSNREQGVKSILAAMRRLLGRTFGVYAGDRVILSEHKVYDIQSVASRNWQATATWLAARCDEGVLVDMGSTTTDIVPFKSRRVAARAYADAARMRCGELVYTGCARTPVMAIAEQIDIEGVDYPIVAELFATAADVYRILGELPEDSDLYPACDQGEKTIAGSARRLERMFGMDWDGDLDATHAKARAVADKQQQKISNALSTVLQQAQLSNRAVVIGAGSGYKIVEYIAESLGLQYMPYHCLLASLPHHLEASVCRCATAISVASLAQRVAY